MKVRVLEVAWHARVGAKNDPIFSLDFHPSYQGLLATAGSDEEVKVWNVHLDATEGVPTANFLFTLPGHNGTVNVVRFSPDGNTLASGADDSSIFLWTPKNGKRWLDVESVNDLSKTLLRGHTSDVYSISWSPDCSRIASGSVDNTAIIWDAEKGRILQTLKDHNNYVQGVAWDPLGDFIATESCDRSVRVYGPSVSKSALRSVEKDARKEQKQNATLDEKDDVYATGKELPFFDPPKKPFGYSLKASSRYYDPSITETGENSQADPNGRQKVTRERLYMDENVPSFFRRLDWTPDGSALIAPCGQSPSENGEVTPTSFLYVRNCWDHPAIRLPGLPSPSVAVRSCRSLYRLRANAAVRSDTLFDFPYRTVFAVATLESVLLYDTEQCLPIGGISNVHFEKLTDLAWSADNSMLMTSSLDGYCSVIVFEDHELGEELPTAEIPQDLRRAFTLARSWDTKKTQNVNPEAKESRTPSSNPAVNEDKNVSNSSPAAARSEPKATTPVPGASTPTSDNAVKTIPEDNAKSDVSHTTTTEAQQPPTNEQNKRRRIAPILLSS